MSQYVFDLNRVAEALAGQGKVVEGLTGPDNPFANGWRAALLAVRVELGETLRSPEAYEDWHNTCEGVSNGAS
jgi:hypothetical protein